MFIVVYAALFFLVTEAVLGVTLEQQHLSVTKEEGKSVYVNCKVTELTREYVHWYQKKDGEALTRILYVKENSPAVHDNHPEANTFDVRIQSDNYDLKITKLSRNHLAVYYCASWDYNNGDWVKVFGSGTRLYVTDQEKKEPAVSMFPVSNEKNGKHVLLCKAQGMFPNLVKFKWNDASGGEVQLSQGGYELLEQTDNEGVRITSMLIVDKSKSSLNKYKCTVKHEKGDFNPSISKDETPVPPTCPPTNTPNEVQEDNLISGESEHSRSLYLFSMTYVMLVVKNMLYFCIIFFLLYKRNSANKGMLKGKVR